MARTGVLVGGLGLLALLAGGPPVARAETPEALYRLYCAQCHGLQGKGDGPNVTKDFPVDPRNFTKADEMNKLSDADIRYVLDNWTDRKSVV